MIHLMILDLRSEGNILRRRRAGLRVQVFLAFIRSPGAKQALLSSGDQIVDIQVKTVRHSISGRQQIPPIRAETDIYARQDEQFLPGGDIQYMRRRISTASRDQSGIRVKFNIDHDTGHLDRWAYFRPVAGSQTITFPSTLPVTRRVPSWLKSTDLTLNLRSLPVTVCSIVPLVTS